MDQLRFLSRGEVEGSEGYLLRRIYIENEKRPRSYSRALDFGVFFEHRGRHRRENLSGRFEKGSKRWGLPAFPVPDHLGEDLKLLL